MLFAVSLKFFVGLEVFARKISKLVYRKSIRSPMNYSVSGFCLLRKHIS